MSQLLSGPSLACLPDLVAALDDMTFPMQRLAAWRGLWVPLAVAGDSAAVAQMWSEEIHPDLAAKFKPAAAPAAGGQGSCQAGSWQGGGLACLRQGTSWHVEGCMMKPASFLSMCCVPKRRNKRWLHLVAPTCQFIR